MKTYQPCLPCIMNLMTSTLEKSALEDSFQQEILERFEKDLSKIDLSLPPGRTAGAVYHQLLNEIGEEDLFQVHKETSLRAAEKLYPRLKQLVLDAPDPLDAAVRVSALGNILDIANPNSYDIDQEINHLLEVKIWGDSMEKFRAQVAQADSLLLLADNAAEAIFDRVLIETLQLPVKYVVKSAPAFDDALLADAQTAGIDRIAQVIESGTPYPGTYLPSCSPEFHELFSSAPLILAKGQANYETLSDIDREIYFLLKVKCEVVESEIKLPLGSLVLKHHHHDLGGREYTQ